MYVCIMNGPIENIGRPTDNSFRGEGLTPEDARINAIQKVYQQWLRYESPVEDAVDFRTRAALYRRCNQESFTFRTDYA